MIDKTVSYKNKNKTAHNVGEILRGLMRFKHIDDSELARETKVALSSISRIKNDPDCNPTLSSLKPLAEYFSVTVSQLIGESALSKMHVAEPARQVMLHVQQIPLIAWSDIAAYQKNNLPPSSHWLSSNRNLNADVFALQIDVDTWGDVFSKNAYLLIDPQAATDNGDYVIVYQQSNDRYVAKRMLKESTSVYLQSLNPDLTQAESLKSDEKIIGRIIEIRQEL